MGQSGASVHAVTTETGAYILRIHGGDDESWQKIILAHEIASQHGVAPAIIHIHTAERAVVSVRIPDASLRSALSQPATRVAVTTSLIEVLIKLHAIPTGPFAAINLISDGRTIWESQVQRPGFPSWAIPLGDRIAEADKLLKHDNRRVLCHCDFHPWNLVWDGQRVWLVDWERAGLSHPYLDLATMCNFLSMPDEAALSMLQQQEQAPMESAQKLLFAALRDFCRVVYGAVFLRLLNDLESVKFTSREDTLPLSECLANLATGKLDVAQPQSRALIGAGFLKQCASPDRD